MSAEMTHKQAVRRITNWMRNTRHFNVVLSELSTRARETPDVIGFVGVGCSTLVECKVSRSDFLADKLKYFRRIEDMGMGDFRYFACPPSLILTTELPEGWGLLEIHDHHIRETVKPKRKLCDKSKEVAMLTSAIRRLEISTAVFVRAEESPKESEARG